MNKTFTIGGDLTVNRVGFGAVRIVGPEFFGMPEDKARSVNVLRRAVELGVNFIDTADQYGPFISEQLIAEALHPYPDDFVVATKGGIVRYGPWSNIKRDATPQHLNDALDGSLRRLKRERIDLYQLHRIDPDVPVELTFGFLRDAQEDGRIRHLGLSEVGIEEIKAAQEFFDVASVQNRYSIENREAEPILDYCRDNGIAFIPWFPIGGGNVGGDTGGEDLLQQVADAHEVGVRQVALAWLLHQADNILLIPGTSNVIHLEENVTGATIDLTPNELAALDSIGASR
jgi:pyridoxine 4-dehydrogenase